MNGAIFITAALLGAVINMDGTEAISVSGIETDSGVYLARFVYGSYDDAQPGLTSDPPYQGAWQIIGAVIDQGFARCGEGGSPEEWLEIGTISRPSRMLLPSRLDDGQPLGTFVSTHVVLLGGFYCIDGFEPYNYHQEFYSHIPVADDLAWLTFAPMPDGDVNGDGTLDVADYELMMGGGEAYDLDGDGIGNYRDANLFASYWFGAGDVDFDGLFDSNDVIEMLSAAQYEDGVEGNSTWADGDFNQDYEFDSNDVLLALATGRYEVGTAFVPEPSAAVLLLLGVAMAIRGKGWR